MRYFGEENRGNVMISPASVKSTLAMILEGADGPTASEIRSALRLSPHKEDYREQLNLYLTTLKVLVFHNCHSSIVFYFQSVQDWITWPSFRDYKNIAFDRFGEHSLTCFRKQVTFAVILNCIFPTVQAKSTGTFLKNANGVFVSENLRLKKEYEMMLQKVYFAEVSRMDFRDPIPTTEKINSWVNISTNGLIPDIVMPGMLGLIKVQELIIGPFTPYCLYVHNEHFW